MGNLPRVVLFQFCSSLAYADAYLEWELRLLKSIEKSKTFRYPNATSSPLVYHTLPT